jgi:hypothetical protein
MATQLYTYSLIRSLYDQGDDLIDSFWPLILNVLPQDEASLLPLEAVQTAIENRYGLGIPQHPLGTIITRAARKGYVVRRNKGISITEQGRQYFLLRIEPERQAERRVNELLSDAKSFMDSRSQTGLSTDRIKEMIQVFVLDNLDTLEQFFSQDGTNAHERKELSTEAERVLLDYFNTVEKTKPIIFQTLQDIVCGSVISAIVHTTELFKETGRRFEKTTVYLDSNYVFSLLNLRYDEENRPAQELFKLMKEEGTFDFKVFDFTLHEITSVLKNYENEERLYQPNIKVRGSLFGSLKAKGWSAAKVREFVVNVEGRLWSELGISITPTDVNLKNYEPEDKNRRRLLLEYKPDQRAKEQNHDLAAIDQIRKLRRRPTKRIEQCQSMFLTSDMKLALFNYIGEEHKENDTISEVIPDRLLTNILWLKNPAANDKLSLDSIIANYSRNLFVNEAVWKQFYKNVVELRREGSLDDSQISILLYGRYIQDVLSNYEPDEAYDIDLSVILKDIEKLRSQAKPIESETPPPIIKAPVSEPTMPPEVGKELAALREKIETLERERNTLIIDTIERWKKHREVEAETAAKHWTLLVKLLIIAILVTAAWLLSRPVSRYWLDVEPFAWLMLPVLTAALSWFGIKLDLFHLGNGLYDHIFNFILRRKLHDLKTAEMNFEVDIQKEDE